MRNIQIAAKLESSILRISTQAEAHSWLGGTELERESIELAFRRDDCMMHSVGVCLVNYHIQEYQKNRRLGMTTDFVFSVLSLLFKMCSCLHNVRRIMFIVKVALFADDGR